MGSLQAPNRSLSCWKGCQSGWRCQTRMTRTSMSPRPGLAASAAATSQPAVYIQAHQSEEDPQ